MSRIVKTDSNVDPMAADEKPPINLQPALTPNPSVPYDLVFFGILMISSGFMDLYIIIANPEYSLPIFGMKFIGWGGWFVKLIAPPIHFISGYGAILGRKWAYRLMMYYSFYGLINATVNRLVLPGPHRIRTIFLAGTLFFIGYLYMRRRQFRT